MMHRLFNVLFLLSLVSLAEYVEGRRRWYYKTREWKDGDVRLIGGGRRYQGTVMIRYKRRWGAICDQDWDRNDAHVVCRQIGYYGASSAPKGSKFGIGKRRMWLSNVNCTGTESRLADCQTSGFDRMTRRSCRGWNRSAGVICLPVKRTTPATTVATVPTTASTTEIKTTPTTTLPKTTTSSTSTTTTTTTTPKIEMATSAPYVTDPSDKLELGFRDTLQALVGSNSSETDAELSQASVEGSIVYSPLAAAGVKSDSPDTDVNFPVPYNMIADDSPDELKLKQLAKQDETDESEMLYADAPKKVFKNLEIRLAGGRYDSEGHVLIKVDGGQWDTVCSDHWTMREAMVACNHLGGMGQAKQALLTNFFGGEKESKRFHRIKCVGRETKLSDCNITLSDEHHTCSKRAAVAGVVCSKFLPDLVPNLRALQDSVRLQDQPLYYLRCSMEENCLSSSAYVIKNTSKTWRNSVRRLLRFSTVVHNQGNADFKPFLQRSLWQWHACHMHYHSMEVFAHYDIMDENGTRLAEGSKASFCLEDTTCDPGTDPRYNCRGFGAQGLSVNCSDNYMYNIDCQWIDITDMDPGEYTFLIEVNPSMLVAESSFDNNVVSCHMYYSGYFASLSRCHFESLLDYRRPVKRPV